MVEQGSVGYLLEPAFRRCKRLVFPAGTPGASCCPPQMVRVAFNGTAPRRPISRWWPAFAIECGALVSIVAADTRVVSQTRRWAACCWPCRKAKRRCRRWITSEVSRHYLRGGGQQWLNFCIEGPGRLLDVLPSIPAGNLGHFLLPWWPPCLLVIGLPLGVLLVTGEPGGVRPLPAGHAAAERRDQSAAQVCRS